MDLKYEAWKKLKKLGYEIWCEVVFKSGIRLDIMGFKEGIFIGIEVLHSETDKQLTEKLKNYPDFDIVGIRTLKEIRELDL